MWDQFCEPDLGLRSAWTHPEAADAMAMRSPSRNAAYSGQILPSSKFQVCSFQQL